MIIRHKSFKDVCFETTLKIEHRHFHIGLYAMTAFGKWMNMGYEQSWYLPCEEQKIDIHTSAEWEKCTEPHAKCLRYAIWEPL